MIKSGRVALPILPADSISSRGKSKNRKWFFEKRDLPKREIRLNIPFFAACGMNVEIYRVVALMDSGARKFAA